MSVLGVDLRTSSKNPSPLALLDEDSRLIWLGNFRQDIEFVEMVKLLEPDLVAIGSPLNLPAGFCCLDQSCECWFSVRDRKSRLLELELAKMGISCFYTNKVSIIKDLIYRGMRLSHELRSAGYDVIEVYPHATKMLLFGDNMPPKNNPSSVNYMISRLETLVFGMDSYMADIDKYVCDAIMNAYTGRLHVNSDTDVLGDPDEGMLVLPKLSN